MEAWSTLYRLLEERRITPVIAGRFELLDAARAHGLLEGGDVIGTIVLIVPAGKASSNPVSPTTPAPAADPA